MNRDFEDNEVELRLNDLILYCCEHWKSIVASMLIFAILLGGVGAYKAISAQESANKTKSEKTESALLALEETASDAEKMEELDNIAHRVALYKQIIKGKENYLSKSVLMNLDSSAVVTETLQYKLSTVSGNITNSAQQQENLQLIVKSYESRLANDELYTAAGEYLKVDSAYVRELISAYDYFPSGTNVYLSTNESMDENITSSAILYVSIKGPDEKYCDSIAEYVKRRIEGIGEGLNDITTPYTITLLNTTVTTGVDNGIVNSKNDALNYIKTVETNITTLEKELSSAEVDYAEAKSDEELETLMADTKAAELETEEVKEETKVNPISKKFIAIGALLGIFLAGGYWLLAYILSSKLLSVYAMEDKYGIKTYALGSGNAPKKGLSAFFRKLRYRTTHFYSCDELAKIFKAEIETLSEKKEITKVFVASSENFNGSNDAFINALKNEMDGSGIEISSGVKIKYDPDMIISISNADVVIVIENIDKSSNFEIDEEMRFIAERNTQVIGTVVQ
ncbi:hypothetical protein QYZ88_010940 [Lachnospiraceae bacterium C1.1]|nr:hypothetical protein [Lachnospiraceae bacterium C1.1]